MKRWMSSVAVLLMAAGAQGATVSNAFSGAGAVIFDNSGLYPSGTSATGAIAYITGQTGQTGPAGKVYPASSSFPMYASLKLGSTTISYLDSMQGNMFVGNLTAAPGNEMQLTVFGGLAHQESIRILFEGIDSTLFPTTDMPASINYAKVSSVTWEFIHLESSTLRTTQGDLDHFHVADVPPPAGIPEPSALATTSLFALLTVRRRKTRVI